MTRAGLARLYGVPKLNRLFPAIITAFFYILISAMAGGLVASAMLTFGADRAATFIFSQLTALVVGVGLFVLERSVRRDRA